MAERQGGWRAVLARALAASAGAYFLCYAWTGALVLLLPMDGVDATILATCLSFPLFVAIILRAFSIRSVTRLWLEIAAGTAVPAAIMLGIPR